MTSCGPHQILLQCRVCGEHRRYIANTIRQGLDKLLDSQAGHCSRCRKPLWVEDLVINPLYNLYLGVFIEEDRWKRIDYQQIYRRDTGEILIAKVKRRPKGTGDLSFAVLPCAELSRANLYGADLWSAKLGSAHLGNADLRRARMIWTDLYLAHLRKADLRGAMLLGANLTGANLEGAVLTDAYMEGANLSKSFLRGTDLRYTHNLRKANLEGARYDKETRWPVRYFKDPTIYGAVCVD